MNNTKTGEVPVWIIPPRKDVIRRQSDTFTQNKIQNRKHGRRHRKSGPGEAPRSARPPVNDQADENNIRPQKEDKETTLKKDEANVVIDTKSDDPHNSEKGKARIGTGNIKRSAVTYTVRKDSCADVESYDKMRRAKSGRGTVLFAGKLVLRGGLYSGNDTNSNYLRPPQVTSLEQNKETPNPSQKSDNSKDQHLEPSVNRGYFKPKTTLSNYSDSDSEDEVRNDLSSRATTDHPQTSYSKQSKNMSKVTNQRGRSGCSSSAGLQEKSGANHSKRRTEYPEEVGSSDSSGDDQEMDNGFTSDIKVPEERCESHSSDYETDCEPDENFHSWRPESVTSKSKKNVDIGHLTYESECAKHQVNPRSRVLRQLRERALSLPHGGLVTSEVLALAPALKINNRIEEVDLSGNFLQPEALSALSDALDKSVHITKINLSQSTFDATSATDFADMLCYNRWLVTLDLSNCGIGDNEIDILSQGIQENRRIETLDLSHNTIGVIGALQLGRALGDNDALRSVNLSWNHIRGGGAVAVGHSLIKNTTIEDLDLSWNGIGFEGSLALGQALRQNKVLKRLNLTNNRINWDCAPHLSPALAANTGLECLELGQNPISMEGCEELLLGIAKPSNNIKYLSLTGIPINTKIVMMATEISKLRPFTLDHGGILNTRDVIGIQRARREDPFSLLIRYLSAMGIRVMDLFRMLDKDNSLLVTRSKFIQGLKRVRVPLDEEDIEIVARRLQSDKKGLISYQELAATVRSRIREDRLEDKRHEILMKKKKEERRRILQSDRPLNAPNNVSHLPGIYHMYGGERTMGGATPATPGLTIATPGIGGARGKSGYRTDLLYSPSTLVGTLSRRSSAYSILPRIPSGDEACRLTAALKVGGASEALANSPFPKSESSMRETPPENAKLDPNITTNTLKARRGRMNKWQETAKEALFLRDKKLI